MKTYRSTFLMPLLALGVLAGSCRLQEYAAPEAPVKEVPFTNVHFSDEFWAPRIETNRKVSIPSAFKECEKTAASTILPLPAD